MEDWTLNEEGIHGGLYRGRRDRGEGNWRWRQWGEKGTRGHLRLKHAQPKMSLSPKVENRVDNFFSSVIHIYRQLFVKNFQLP